MSWIPLTFAQLPQPLTNDLFALSSAATWKAYRFGGSWLVIDLKVLHLLLNPAANLQSASHICISFGTCFFLSLTFFLTPKTIILMNTCQQWDSQSIDPQRRRQSEFYSNLDRLLHFLFILQKSKWSFYACYVVGDIVWVCCFAFKLVCFWMNLFCR